MLPDSVRGLLLAGRLTVGPIVWSGPSWIWSEHVLEPQSLRQYSGCSSGGRSKAPVEHSQIRYAQTKELEKLKVAAGDFESCRFGGVEEEVSAWIGGGARRRTW